MPDIRLTDGEAAVLHDFVTAMADGPVSPSGILTMVRQSRLLQPLLEREFERVGFDPEFTERPDLPPLVAGGRHD